MNTSGSIEGLRSAWSSAASSPFNASSVVRSLDPQGFAESIANATEEDRLKQSRQAAEDLVAVALVQPTLKMLRESNNAAPPFAPGDAERTFGAFYDAEIARRLVSSRGFGLVENLAHRIANPHGWNRARAASWDNGRRVTILEGAGE